MGLDKICPLRDVAGYKSRIQKTIFHNDNDRLVYKAMVGYYFRVISIHAPDNGPVLVDAQRGHAVRNEADLVAVLLGKASVQQGQLQKVRNEYILVLYIDLALSNKYILIKPLSAVENSHALWYHICRVYSDSVLFTESGFLCY